MRRGAGFAEQTTKPSLSPVRSWESPGSRLPGGSWLSLLPGLMGLPGFGRWKPPHPLLSTLSILIGWTCPARLLSTAHTLLSGDKAFTASQGATEPRGCNHKSPEESGSRGKGVGRWRSLSPSVARQDPQISQRFLTTKVRFREDGAARDLPKVTTQATLLWDKATIRKSQDLWGSLRDPVALESHSTSAP